MYKQLGFFKELNYGDGSGGTLSELIQDTPHEWENEIVDYLSTQEPFIVSLGISYDVFYPDKIIGAPNIFTDGVWYWSEDLPYYIKNYHVKLPDEFIEYVKKQMKLDK